MLKHFQLFKLQSVNTAFTLAEVLITLAIIGIVAAVTIPSLTQKYEEKQYLIKLKKNIHRIKSSISVCQRRVWRA